MSAGNENNAFRYVESPRRKRKGKNTRAPQAPGRLLQRCLRELKDGQWLHESLDLVRDSLSELGWEGSIPVLCLGLGSPTASENAAAQLALLLGLCDELNVDITLLKGLEIQCLTENLVNASAPFPHFHSLKLVQNGRYEMDSQTLVFMPHCDVQLYEAILGQNWTIGKLPNMLFICNKFSEYETTKFQRKYPHLFRYRAAWAQPSP
ncbi:hypothetical protein GLOTRDRAFT_119946 [Gloeophyllum trabeum ATCC 11539]|uniref:SRR1-like domain-containing protein n=1 Tax=Gloeophyllum trabeum (strain ATCC 11539 / FP-39264 / Madison 617) TaxID=670483 RepID=S7RTQ7_GLOTA|nr:uncharacterized protein GLOTRDRAFT_119946 [Gloeophyllum trabeum ATCC 11539]EPQ58055.1 hypothetical protein GLOTRDRAFT_119946 [Gloeophyllum trabeum ATCC 11539]